MQNPTSERAGKLILDTNIWINACALGAAEGPDNNSKHDRQVREEHRIDPRKYRGALIQVFKKHYTIVPEKVAQELYGLANNMKGLSAKNQAQVQTIVQTLFGRETPIRITRADLEEQNRIFKQIEVRAKASLGNPSQLNVACSKTWKKIKDHGVDTETALRSCPTNDQHPYTKILDELEELRRRKNELTTTPETARDYFRKTTNLEDQARRVKPFLLPDLEILLCAEATKASVLSADVDMETLWACSERLQKSTKKPVTIGPIAGLEAEFKVFTKEANKSARKDPPKDYEGGM